MRNEALESTAKKFLGRPYNAGIRDFEPVAPNLTGDIALSSAISECYTSISDSIESCEKEMSARLRLGADVGNIRSMENGNGSVTVHARQSGLSAQIGVRRASQENECHLLMTAVDKIRCTLQNAIGNHNGHAFVQSGESIIGYHLSIKFHSSKNLDELRRSIGEKGNLALIQKMLSLEKNTQTQNTETSYQLNVSGIGGYHPPTHYPKERNESVADYFERVSAAVAYDFQNKRDTLERIFNISWRGLVPYDVTPDTKKDLETLLNNYDITLKKLQSAYELLEGEKLKDKQTVSRHISFDELLECIKKIQAEKNYLEEFSALPACIKDQSFETCESLKNNADQYLERLKQIKLIATNQPIIIQLTDAKGLYHYLYLPKKQNFCAITAERDLALPLEVEFSDNNALPYLDDGLNGKTFYLKLPHKDNYLKVTDFSKLSAREGAGVAIVDKKDNATLWKLDFINHENVHDKNRCLKNAKTTSRKWNYALTANYKEENGVFYINTGIPSLSASSLQVEFEAHQPRNSFGVVLDNALEPQARLSAKASEELETRSQKSSSTRKTQNIETQSQAGQSDVIENTPSSATSSEPLPAPLSPSSSESNHLGETTTPASTLSAQPLTVAPEEAESFVAPAPPTWDKILKDLIVYYVALSDDSAKKAFIEKWNMLFLSTEMNFLQKLFGMSAPIKQYHHDLLPRASLLKKGVLHFQEINSLIKERVKTHTDDGALEMDAGAQQAIKVWLTESVKNLPKSNESLEKREAVWTANCNGAKKKVANFQKEKLVDTDTELPWPQATLHATKTFLKDVIPSLSEDQLNTFLAKIQRVILGTEDVGILDDDQVALSNLLDMVFEEYRKCANPNDAQWAEIIRGLMLSGTDPSAWITKNIVSLQEEDHVVNETGFQFLYLLLNQIDFIFSHMLRRAKFLGDSTVYLGDKLTNLIVRTNTFSKKLQQCTSGKEDGFCKERAIYLAAVLIYVSLFLNSPQPDSGNTQVAFWTIKIYKLFYEQAGHLANINLISRAMRNTGLAAGDKLESAVNAVNRGLLEPLQSVRESHINMNNARIAFYEKRLEAEKQEKLTERQEKEKAQAQTEAEKQEKLTERQEKEKAQAQIATMFLSSIRHSVAPYKNQLTSLQQSVVDLLAGRKLEALEALEALTGDELGSFTVLQNKLSALKNKIANDFLKDQEEDGSTDYNALQIHEAISTVLRKQAETLTPASTPATAPLAAQTSSSNQPQFFKSPQQPLPTASTKISWGLPCNGRP